MWLGANDLKNHGTFIWQSDNKSLNSSFTNWNEGEPNNRGDEERCVEMSYISGKWNDVPCNWGIFSTVCEKIIRRL